MKIALCTSYDVSVDGGVNAHVFGLGRALRRKGHQVQILGPCSGLLPEGCTGFAGVVPIAANGSTARIGLRVVTAAVSRTLSEGDFDLVHVHEPLVPGPSRTALGWAKVTGVPVVATFHAFAEHEGIGSRWLRQLASRPLRQITAAIAVSSHAAQFARSVYKQLIEVIPNGIQWADFSSINSRPRHSSLPMNRPLEILFVGRFEEPRKGLRVLLSAIEQLERRGIPVHLTVAGAGNSERFSPGAEAHRAAVRFVGRLSENELVQAYRSCDVFCAPSLAGESFGIVLAEAMASGCPVVASDLLGYREAASGAALFVPPGDPNALAQALQRAGQDELLRLELFRRGRQRSRELDWANLVEQVALVYRTAIHARAPVAVSVGATVPV